MIYRLKKDKAMVYDGKVTCACGKCDLEKAFTFNEEQKEKFKKELNMTEEVFLESFEILNDVNVGVSE